MMTSFENSPRHLCYYYYYCLNKNAFKRGNYMRRTSSNLKYGFYSCWTLANPSSQHRVACGGEGRLLIICTMKIIKSVSEIDDIIERVRSKLYIMVCIVLACVQERHTGTIVFRNRKNNGRWHTVPRSVYSLSSLYRPSTGDRGLSSSSSSSSPYIISSSSSSLLVRVLTVNGRVRGDKIKFRNQKHMCDFNSSEENITYYYYYEAEWVARCV